MGTVIRFCSVCGTEYRPLAGNQLTCSRADCRRQAQSARASLWYVLHREQHKANVAARRRRPLCLPG